MTKLEAYRAGKYRFKAPPVPTIYWTEADWVMFIDMGNGWTVEVID